MSYSDEYHKIKTRKAFEAWQARATLSKQPIAPVGEDVVALINEQAEDEALWAQAETALEAYVQQELRKLHAAIEGK